MRTDKLNTFEQENLNRFLLHHMSMETRRKLMTEYPVIYRKLLGKDANASFRAAVKEAVLEGYPARPGEGKSQLANQLPGPRVTVNLSEPKESGPDNRFFGSFKVVDWERDLDRLRQEGK